jgi:hypothetical protein
MAPPSAAFWESGAEFEIKVQSQHVSVEKSLRYTAAPPNSDKSSAV